MISKVGSSHPGPPRKDTQDQSCDFSPGSQDRESERHDLYDQLKGAKSPNISRMRGQIFPKHDCCCEIHYQ